MLGKVQRWGNSFAVRIPKNEVDRLGLGEGSTVDVSLRPVATTDRIDISDRPTFRDRDPRLSLHVDDVLYGED